MGDDSASPEDTTGAEECQGANASKAPWQGPRGADFFFNRNILAVS